MVGYRHTIPTYSLAGCSTLFPLVVKNGSERYKNLRRTREKPISDSYFQFSPPGDAHFSTNYRRCTYDTQRYLSTNDIGRRRRVFFSLSLHHNYKLWPFFRSFSQPDPFSKLASIEFAFIQQKRELSGVEEVTIRNVSQLKNDRFWWCHPSSATTVTPPPPPKWYREHFEK